MLIHKLKRSLNKLDNQMLKLWTPFKISIEITEIVRSVFNSFRIEWRLLTQAKNFALIDCINYG